MKRIFLVGAIAISAMALATASGGTGNAKGNPAIKKAYYQDTIPGKKDTTHKPKKDSTLITPSFKFN